MPDKNTHHTPGTNAGGDQPDLGSHESRMQRIRILQEERAMHESKARVARKRHDQFLKIDKQLCEVIDHFRAVGISPEDIIYDCAKKCFVPRPGVLPRA